jgi:P2-related tail formation protein
MTSLPGGSLVQYLNPQLAQDPIMITWAQTMDTMVSETLEQIPYANILGNLVNQPESVLDFVALYWLNVDFYDTTLPYANKLYLVQNAILFKMIKGSKLCLQLVLSNTYGYVQVIQWFDPNFNANGVPGALGAPYTFRLQFAGDITDPALMANVNQLVLKYKNVRSLCVTIEPLSGGTTTEYVGCAIGVYKRIIAWTV